MAARVRSLRNGAAGLSEVSRDDLVPGDVITVSSLDSATTYLWTLAYVPAGSTATFSGSSSAISPGSFTVDLVGAYLVRLVTNAGLETQSSQYVRLRALSEVLGLSLVAAGERRDESGIVPVDASTTGWADTQNGNLLSLEAAIANLQDVVLESTENSVDVGTSANIILSNASSDASVEVLLPSGADHRTRKIIVKDKKGDAGGLTPITVTPADGETIDSQTSLAINVDYGSATLVFHGSEWSLVG